MALFGTAVLSGNHDLILDALDTLTHFEQVLIDKNMAAHRDAVLNAASTALKSYLTQIQSQVQSCAARKIHCMQK